MPERRWVVYSDTTGMEGERKRVAELIWRFGLIVIEVMLFSHISLVMMTHDLLGIHFDFILFSEKIVCFIF